MGTIKTGFYAVIAVALAVIVYYLFKTGSSLADWLCQNLNVGCSGGTPPPPPPSQTGEITLGGLSGALAHAEQDFDSFVENAVTVYNGQQGAAPGSENYGVFVAP